MKESCKKFWKLSIQSLFLTSEGALSLPKLLALGTSGVATYRFIIMDSNDPWLWLVYLGVVGGHGVAAKLLERFGGSKSEDSR